MAEQPPKDDDDIAGSHPTLDWDDDDPERPCNWPGTRIWTNLGIITFSRLLTPLASSAIAPAQAQISRELGGGELVGTLVVSIYLLGYTLGPLVLAPLSEIYGRLPVYHVCNVLFAVWNVACALSPDVGGLLAFRLLAGLAGSCPVTLGNGSIADFMPRDRRGRATAIFTVGPLLGPVIGPIAGGFLGEAAGWRWIFWLLAIVSAVWAILSFVFLSETYEPVLLERRAKRLWQRAKGDQLRYHFRSTETKKEVFMDAITRPLLMFFTSPAVFITSIYVGLVYGYMYLLFTSFGSLYTSVYGFSEGEVGLTYLGYGVGAAVGLLVVGTLSDRLVEYLSPPGTWKPEFRLLPLLPGSLLVPVGLFWYGWSAQARVHWILPIIGPAWVGIGVLAVFMPVQAYLIDIFPEYAASAAAANTLFRSLVGMLLPLAGPMLYQSLGQGWGNSLLAFLALLFTPISWLAYKYGEEIRTRYPGNIK